MMSVVSCKIKVNWVFILQFITKDRMLRPGLR